MFFMCGDTETQSITSTHIRKDKVFFLLARIERFYFLQSQWRESWQSLPVSVSAQTEGKLMPDTVQIR